MFENPNDKIGRILNDNRQSHLEVLAAIKNMAANLAEIQDYFVKQKREDKSLINIQSFEQTFRSDGYLFNSLTISDVSAADNAALIVNWNGLIYTITLVAGENDTNIPDGATYKIKTTSTNPIQALLSRYNMLS